MLQAEVIPLLISTVTQLGNILREMIPLVLEHNWGAVRKDHIEDFSGPLNMEGARGHLVSAEGSINSLCVITNSKLSTTTELEDNEL
jgi:hypothetical protein